MRVLFALLFMALASSASAQDVPEEDPVEPGTTQEQSTEQPAIEPESIPAVTPTEPPGTEHDGSAAENGAEDATDGSDLIFGDGVAQWVMAVTGVGALGLSAWAVWLLRQTLLTTQETLNQAAEATQVAKRSLITTRASMKLQLREARESVAAVQVSNRIMQDQQRPWVTLERDAPCELRVGDESAIIDWSYKITNKGKLPAQAVVLHCMVVRYDETHRVVATFQAYVAANRKLVGEARKGTDIPLRLVIFPGESHVARLTQSSEISSEGENFALMACVTYRHSDDIGIDAHLFGIVPDGTRHKLVSFGEVRIVE